MGESKRVFSPLFLSSMEICLRTYLLLDNTAMKIVEAFLGFDNLAESLC